jgi:hypothetical protein
MYVGQQVSWEKSNINHSDSKHLNFTLEVSSFLVDYANWIYVCIPVYNKRIYNIFKMFL